MDQQTFNTIVEAQIDRCQDVLVDKGEEYATMDVLHNFKQAAHMQDVNMRKALAGMMIKHTTSVYDMIRSVYQYDLEIWDEKITDHINYLLLLKAVVFEENADMMNSIEEISLRKLGEQALEQSQIAARQKVLEEMPEDYEYEKEEHKKMISAEDEPRTPVEEYQRDLEKAPGKLRDRLEGVLRRDDQDENQSEDI